MRRAEQQPVIPESWVRYLRVAAVAAAYGLYRWLESSHEIVPSAFVAFGSLLVLYTVITRYGTWRRDRSGMMQVGQTALGLGLIGAGIVAML